MPFLMTGVFTLSAYMVGLSSQKKNSAETNLSSVLAPKVDFTKLAGYGLAGGLAFYFGRKLIK